jgi:hypothetical protein
MTADGFWMILFSSQFLRYLKIFFRIAPRKKLTYSWWFPEKSLVQWQKSFQKPLGTHIKEFLKAAGNFKRKSAKIVVLRKPLWVVVPFGSSLLAALMASVIFKRKEIELENIISFLEICSFLSIVMEAVLKQAFEYPTTK